MDWTLVMAEVLEVLPWAPFAMYGCWLLWDIARSLRTIKRVVLMGADRDPADLLWHRIKTGQVGMSIGGKVRRPEALTADEEE